MEFRDYSRERQGGANYIAEKMHMDVSMGF
jgi:hypothetical protein